MSDSGLSSPQARSSKICCAREEKALYAKRDDATQYKNFAGWWKNKGHFFSEARAEKGSGRKNRPGVLSLRVPLNQPSTESIKPVKVILAEEVNACLKRLYDRKLTAREKLVRSNTQVGRYKFAGEIKCQSLQDTPIIYRNIYIIKGYTEIGRHLSNSYIYHFKNKITNKRVSKFLGDKNDYLSTLKNLWGNIGREKKLLTIARLESFPGELD